MTERLDRDRRPRPGRHPSHLVDGRDWREAPTRLAVRRAVLGCLMRARRPMQAIEIRDAVLKSRPMLWHGRPLTTKKVTEILRNQLRGGRVQRVSRGVWAAPRQGFPKTTRWRYETWEREWDADIRARSGCGPT